MHLFTPAGEVVLTPGVAENVLHLNLATSIFPVSAPNDNKYVNSPYNQT
jgi:hypothetical protein